MRAAAVRLINYFVPTTELANQIADALEDGLALPAPVPTTGAAGAAMPRSCDIDGVSGQSLSMPVGGA
jgi:hypothetical protein